MDRCRYLMSSMCTRTRRLAIVNRQPLLLLVSSTSLLPILVPARDVRALPNPLVDLVRGRQRCAVESSMIDAEVRAMEPVMVAPTVDRSVLTRVRDGLRDLVTDDVDDPTVQIDRTPYLKAG